MEGPPFLSPSPEAHPDRLTATFGDTSTMIRPTVLLTTAAAALAACASTPGAIAPAAMPVSAYDTVSCEHTLAMRNAEQANLSALESKQSGTAAADAIGVFFLLVPVGSLTGGDHSGEIAASKGRMQAMDARLLSCGARPAV